MFLMFYLFYEMSDGMHMYVFINAAQLQILVGSEASASV